MKRLLPQLAHEFRVIVDPKVQLGISIPNVRCSHAPTSVIE